MPPDGVASPLTSVLSALAAASADVARMRRVARVGAALGRALGVHALFIALIAVYVVAAFVVPPSLGAKSHFSPRLYSDVLLKVDAAFFAGLLFAYVSHVLIRVRPPRLRMQCLPTTLLLWRWSAIWWRPCCPLPARSISAASPALTRRSVSIMPEARRLVTGGPYRFLRHPVYLFEETAVIGLVLPYASVWALLWLLIHLGFQFQRMKNEERVLSSAFPEYADYARRPPRLIPGLY